MIFISNFASSVDHDENNPSVHHIEQTQNRVRYKPPHHYDTMKLWPRGWWEMECRNGKKMELKNPQMRIPSGEKFKEKNAKGRKKRNKPQCHLRFCLGVCVLGMKCSFVTLVTSANLRHLVWISTDHPLRFLDDEVLNNKVHKGMKTNFETSQILRLDALGHPTHPANSCLGENCNLFAQVGTSLLRVAMICNPILVVSRWKFD